MVVVKRHLHDAEPRPSERALPRRQFPVQSDGFIQLFRLIVILQMPGDLRLEHFHVRALTVGGRGFGRPFARRFKFAERKLGKRQIQHRLDILRRKLQTSDEQLFGLLEIPDFIRAPAVGKFILAVTAAASDKRRQRGDKRRSRKYVFSHTHIIPHINRPYPHNKARRRETGGVHLQHFFLTCCRCRPLKNGGR